MTTRIKIKCDRCEKEFEQRVEYLSQIEWVCPKCKYSDKTFTIELEDDEPNDEPIVMGKGGCGKQKNW